MDYAGSRVAHVVPHAEPDLNYSVTWQYRGKLNHPNWKGGSDDVNGWEGGGEGILLAFTVANFYIYFSSIVWRDYLIIFNNTFDDSPVMDDD